jgi:protein MAK11
MESLSFGESKTGSHSTSSESKSNYLSLVMINSVSAVKTLSLHPTGRMLLVLYQNNMMRLWNMLEGRCSFKKKLGIIEHDYEDSQRRDEAVMVKWEPKLGETYAILFDKKIQVLRTDREAVVSEVSSDQSLTCMEFLSDNEVIAGDCLGRFLLVKGIQDAEKVSISIIETSSTSRFKSIKCSTSQNDLVSISAEGKICFWNVD